MHANAHCVSQGLCKTKGLCTYVEVGVELVLVVDGASDVLVEVVVGMLEDDDVVLDDVLEVDDVEEVELVELVLLVEVVVGVVCKMVNERRARVSFRNSTRPRR